MRSERVVGRVSSFEQDIQPQAEETLPRRGSSDKPAVGFIERSKRVLRTRILKVVSPLSKKIQS